MCRNYYAQYYHYSIDKSWMNLTVLHLWDFTVFVHSITEAKQGKVRTIIHVHSSQFITQNLCKIKATLTMLKRPQKRNRIFRDLH